MEKNKIIFKYRSLPNKYYMICIGRTCDEVYAGHLKYKIEGENAEIDEIRLRPEFQGQGLGTILLKKFEEVVSNSGVTHISGFFCPDDTLQGFLFYHYNGYTIDKNKRLSKFLTLNDINLPHSR